MSIWKYVGAGLGGVGGFFLGGPAGAVAGASLGYGIGQSADASNAMSDAANNTFRANYTPMNPNAGIGMGSFGLTDRERYEQQQRLAASGMTEDQANKVLADNAAAKKRFVDEYMAKNGGGNPLTAPKAMAQMMKTPEWQAFSQVENQFKSLVGSPQADMSDPGRFAAMAEGAQGRQGINMTRYGVDKTANPEFVGMQRFDAPALQEMQRFGVDKFNAQQFDIDPLAGNNEFQQAQDVRNKNLEVMNQVQDRAMGRGGPSPAELQMRQGQDRAISQQAALAASGGQMDYAQARRQAMMGAADISQKTSADQAILRANEQISAQNTFGGMASAQQSSDLTARGQTMGQANARAQFQSNQALQGAQFQAQQAQFESQLRAQQERDAIASRVGQMQFGAQFGASQEQERARQAIQQGQWNANFGSQQDQWASQFQAQQELAQANMFMSQRGMNDQYQAMLLNNYMNSRGMQQRNEFQNQQAQLEAQRINAGISTGNQQAQMQAAGAQMQQGTAMIGMGATLGASAIGSGMFSGSGSSAGGLTQAKDFYGNNIYQNSSGQIFGGGGPTYVPPPR